MTDINRYNNLTVEIIEDFIRVKIREQYKEVGRYMNARNGQTAILLHDSMLVLTTLEEFKRGLKGHDLLIKCRPDTHEKFRSELNEIDGRYND